MVNWRSPETVLSQYTSFTLLQHCLTGIYLWEFFSNLDYDWKLIRRQKRLKWTPVAYLICRVGGVAALVTITTGLDIKGQFNCQAWLICVYCFAYMTIFLSSTLIGIRVIAIWNRNMFAIGFVILVLMAFLGTFLHGVIMAKSVWDPASDACVVQRSEQNLPNAIGGLVVDLLLFGAMLIGLFRLREARRFGVWRMLWRQGLIWIVLATVAEVPSVVFLSLNLNTAMNLMFLTPEMTVLLIGATRMYRQLSNFLSPDSSTEPSDLIESGINDQHLHRRARPKDIESNGISMVPLEVSVHRVQEEHDELKLQESKDDLSQTSRDDKVQAI